MYLRESKQKRADGSVVIYMQLAENVWNPDNGRSQAHIIFNCDRADDAETTEKLRRLARRILRRCSPEEIVSDGDGWQLDTAWPYGDVYVLEAIWRRLGIDSVIRQQTASRRFGFDLERALCLRSSPIASAPPRPSAVWLPAGVLLGGVKVSDYRALDVRWLQRDGLLTQQAPCRQCN